MIKLFTGPNFYAITQHSDQKEDHWLSQLLINNHPSIKGLIRIAHHLYILGRVKVPGQDLGAINISLSQNYLSEPTYPSEELGPNDREQS